jgi:hypothetical protein
MPERALIPLIPALTGGFIAGAVMAITQQYGTAALVVGLLVGLVVAVFGFLSVVKAPGEESERWIVGALRGVVAAATFGFLYAGILYAVRDGSAIGLLWLLFAGVFGLLLTRFRVRERGELQAQ